MTQPQLRITQPDELPAPRVDSDSATVHNDAIDDARDQGPTWTEIAQLLNISTTTAQRHHRQRP